MVKKLEGNAMWESSRMMLPEHREAILKSKRELKEIECPELDEQEIVILNVLIRSSLQYKRVLILTLYRKYEPEIITGTVISVLSEVKQIKIKPWNSDEECLWISLAKVMKAEMKELIED